MKERERLSRSQLTGPDPLLPTTEPSAGDGLASELAAKQLECDEMREGLLSLETQLHTLRSPQPTHQTTTQTEPEPHSQALSDAQATAERALEELAPSDARSLHDVRRRRALRLSLREDEVESLLSSKIELLESEKVKSEKRQKVYASQLVGL